MLQSRYEVSPEEVRVFSTDQIREKFLIPDLSEPGKLNLTYSHYDRVIIGGIVPEAQQKLALENFPELRAEYFLERRELGVINVGGPGKIIVDGQAFSLSKLDALYIGKGVKEVIFTNDGEEQTAVFFLLSAPAHQSYPTKVLRKEDASPVQLGSEEKSNKRTIYKYIHPGGLKSCQLVMGLTVLKTGSVWNTMPCHVHDRRMEVYFYFDLPEEERVFHFMGQPSQ